MEQIQETPKTTTVSVDVGVRDFLAEEAARQGLSQRQVIAHIVKAYKQMGDNPEDNKGVERIIAYMRQQEKMFLAPNLKSAQTAEMQMKVLVEHLTEYIKAINNHGEN